MATSYLEDKSKYRANQYAATWSGEEPYDVDDIRLAGLIM